MGTLETFGTKIHKANNINGLEKQKCSRFQNPLEKCSVEVHRVKVASSLVPLLRHPEALQRQGPSVKWAGCGEGAWRMRGVVQRVTSAEVRVKGKVIGRIGRGLVVLVGIGKEDTPGTGQSMADKIVRLRIFDDQEGRMNLDIREADGALLVVSEFTLYGDCRKGRRPNYAEAAPPDAALPLYHAFVDSLRALGVKVETGEFRAMMELELVNDGPVTLLLDSERTF
jgi:D-aminoacyl-tRNA deacylase